MLAVLLMVNLLIIFWCMSDLPVYLRIYIWKRLYKGIPFKEDFLLKPIQCSFCLGVWAGLFILLWFGFNPLNVTIALLFAYFNSILEESLRVVKDFFIWLLDKLHSLFYK